MRTFTLVDKRTGEITFAGIEANHSNPCWVCKDLHRRPSWCLVDVTRGVAICARVESDRRIGDAGWWHGDINAAATAVLCRGPLLSNLPKEELLGVWQRCQEQVTTQDYVELAEALGLPVADFPVYIDIGSYGSGRAWALTMRDENGQLCGIKLRHRDGTKSCVRGSRLGLIWPRTFDPSASSIVVTEGESDAIVAAQWGLNACGRPGAKACSGILETVCKGKDVALIADRDSAGMDGARLLASGIRKRCRTCVIVTPPPGIKDVRDWHAKGGNAAALQWLVRSARGW